MIGKRLFGGKKEPIVEMQEFQDRMRVLHNMFTSAKMLREEYIYFVMPRVEQD